MFEFWRWRKPRVEIEPPQLPLRRGVCHLNCQLLTPWSSIPLDIVGWHSVVILEETSDLYHVRFEAAHIQGTTIPKWLAKNTVQLIGQPSLAADEVAVARRLLEEVE